MKEDVVYFVTDADDLYAIANLHGKPIKKIKEEVNNDLARNNITSPPYKVHADYIECLDEYACDISPVQLFEENLYDAMKNYKKSIEEITSLDEFKMKFGCDGNLPGFKIREDDSIEFVLAHGCPYIGLIIEEFYVFLEGQWDRGKYRMIINCDVITMENTEWLDEAYHEANSL
jgi:hypothetical protein